MSFNGHARKEHFEIEGDRLFDRNCRVDRLRIVIAELRWNGHKAWEIFFRNFDPCQLPLVSFGISHYRCHVQAEVANEGKWMGGIDSQGGENRKDRGLEIVINPGALGLIELRVIKQLNVVIF